MTAIGAVVLVTLVVVRRVVTMIVSMVVRVVTLLTGGILPQTYQQTLGMSGQLPWAAQVLLSQFQTKPSGQGWQTVLGPWHWSHLGWE